MITPIIGIEAEHLAKAVGVRNEYGSQRVGAEMVLRALNRYVLGDPTADRGVSSAYSRWGAADDSLALGDGSAAYSDLDQPETNTPEATTPRVAYLHFCAVERALALAVQPLADEVYVWLMNRTRRGTEGFVYRAGHVNIQMRRSDFMLLARQSFGTVLRAYLPFTAACAVLLGSGAVGDDQEDDARLCCQRIESTERIFPNHLTTGDRSLSLNLRGVSEALTSDKQAIRNHVIGPHDTTVSPTMELRTALVQAATYALLRAAPPEPYPDLTLRFPLTTASLWNRDPWACVELMDGRQLSALDVAEAGAEWLDRFLTREEFAEVALPEWPHYARWLREIIDALRRRDLEASGVEWAAKRVAFEGLDTELAADLDVLWHQVTPELFAEGGEHLARDCGHAPPFTEDELAAALLRPPVDTRAYLRGHLLQRCLAEREPLEMRDWDGLNLPRVGVRLTLPTPESCSQAELGSLEGMTVDGILNGPAQAYVSGLGYAHRYRTQHHTQSEGTVSTIYPLAQTGLHPSAGYDAWGYTGSNLSRVGGLEDES